MTDVVIPPFQAFSKIPRLNRDCTITEKIDGTNGIVYVSDDLSMVLAGSRSRWLKPGEDNFGFGAWVHEHRDELVLLGPGYHYGEWWGKGIQRGYNQSRKHFSLFNVDRWDGRDAEHTPPECCRVVPVLFRGPFTTPRAGLTLLQLEQTGSVAAPGFMQPEGVCVYHHAAGLYFKATVEGDEAPKSKSELRRLEVQST